MIPLVLGHGIGGREIAISILISLFASMVFLIGTGLALGAADPLAKNPPAARMTPILIWAITHALIGGLIVAESQSIVGDGLVFGTLVTAVVLLGATGSLIPVAGCIAAWGVHFATFPLGQGEFLPLVIDIVLWNSVVIIGTRMGRPRSRTFSQVCCPTCGCSLAGLARPVCPKCHSPIV